MKNVSDPEPAPAPTRTVGIYIGCAMSMAGILVLDLKIPLGVAVVILYNAVILLALNTRSKRFILSLAIVASLLTVFPLFHKESIDEMWKAICNRSLALFAIWAEVYLGLQRWGTEEKREHALREREKAMEEVRVLQGFLPICASCKRIRDLEGSWTLLEKYISEHSEVMFSHGLCPECTRKLFPQLFDPQQRR
jgi:hypothetical protein